MPATMRQPHFALLLGLAWLLIVIQLLAQHWSATALVLADTDDAMRLAQLRDWLAGQGWYDLTQRRIAGGYKVAALVAPDRCRTCRHAGPVRPVRRNRDGRAADAHRVADAVAAADDRRRGRYRLAHAGREAALIVLLLAVIGLPAFNQFRPGRIDHHNVQIALSMLVVAATVWSGRVRWAALAAGAVTGLAMAVGLECLPYLLVCAAAFAVRYVINPNAARASGEYGLALAAASLAGFLILVGPDRWSRAACDEIAINWLALTVIGGTGLALAARFASDDARVRCMQMLLAGGVAVALFLWIEPRCARGPYAMMDPVVWPIWLAHVHEMKPLIALTVESR